MGIEARAPFEAPPSRDCALHRLASLHGLPWLHLLDSVSLVHLAIGLLAQPLYFWKPALDNHILSPDIGLLEPSFLSSEQIFLSFLPPCLSRNHSSCHQNHPLRAAWEESLSP